MEEDLQVLEPEKQWGNKILKKKEVKQREREKDTCYESNREGNCSSSTFQFFIFLEKKLKKVEKREWETEQTERFTGPGSKRLLYSSYIKCNHHRHHQSEKDEEGKMLWWNRRRSSETWSPSSSLYNSYSFTQVGPNTNNPRTKKKLTKEVRFTKEGNLNSFFSFRFYASLH